MWSRTAINNLVIRWPLIKGTLMIADNTWWRLRLSLGWLDTDSGTAHKGRFLESSITYIEDVFADYKKYGGINKFTGKLAEIGPGDSAGIALLMRKDGCVQVDLVDRYCSRQNKQSQELVYGELSRRHDLDAFLTGLSWDDKELMGVTWHHGDSAENYFAQRAKTFAQDYDFIVSRAVMEHLFDPVGCLREMARCLRSGGKMLHKIDMSDHGMFTPSHHELAWLGVPGRVLRWMNSHKDRPNRVLVYRYREILDELKQQGLIDYSLLVTRLVGVGEISPHREWSEIDQKIRQESLRLVESKRPKFAREFRGVDAQDLAIAGVFLIVNRL